MQDWESRAKSAGLVYIQNFEDGLTRRKCGKGFKYLALDGSIVNCKVTRHRIVSLVIPPAWRDVWICPEPLGHIQATGFDEAGRKQYIYHQNWHAASAEHKYGRLKSFARYLPAIRRRVKEDLKSDGLNKTRVVAAVVRLLDKASVRIGNKQYLEANDSRGATTLTADNVSCSSDQVSFNFRGKSGKQIELKCHDEGLAAVIEDCEKSDGEFLFSYQNDHGESVAVTSSDVNGYLLAIAKESVTAKDFRTWRGSVVALSSLVTADEPRSKTAKKRQIVEAVKAAAAALGNTPAVCRRSYIHYAILATAEAGSLSKLMQKIENESIRVPSLTKNENRLVAFLTHLEKQESLPSRRRRIPRQLAA